jgi:hypothetical protein
MVVDSIGVKDWCKVNNRPYSPTTKGFDVYRNGQFIGFVPGQSKRVRLETAKALVRSTHIATWHKADKGFEYQTTIGVYLFFEPCKRLTEVLSNYRIAELESDNGGVYAY